MPKQVSSVSQHPQKQRVIDGILAGESLRSIAESVTPPLSKGAVQRYKDAIVKPAYAHAFNKVNELRKMRDDCNTDVSVSQPTERGYNTRPDSIANRDSDRASLVKPFLTRIAAKYDRYDRLLKTAEKGQVIVDKEGKPVTLSPDLKAIAALDACETRSMDLHAKLVGAIAPDASQQVTNNIVLMLPRPVDAAPARPMLDDGNCIDIEPVE